MTTSDYEAGDLDAVDIGQVLRALGEPVRLAIVRKLADGQAHAKSIEEWDLGMQKSALSHHFRALRLLGLTEVIVTGRSHAIRLRRDEIDRRFPGLLDAVLHAPQPTR
ncbi:ArsR/SmtB family transcription factor [Tsukamurella soli]|uniref:Helix-turn-helix transcriptional regulator n=1 Tax=Tsukamurella soli TaxID=644556 RepID=A0ABP8KGS4_9ACTN